MREILFRGKDESGILNHQWQFGALDNTDEKFPKIIRLDRWGNKMIIGVVPETVDEFTGLYNGAKQRIFEDDVVRFEGELYRVRREDETPGGYWASTAYILQHIGWDDYMSFVDTIDDFCNEICVEILGNIHDNPELLEVR